MRASSLVYGPVRTLHAVEGSGELVFSIGNRLFYQRCSIQWEANALQPLTQVLCEVPSGSTILAVTSSPVVSDPHRTEISPVTRASAHRYALFSAGDCVYWRSFPEPPLPLTPATGLFRSATDLPLYPVVPPSALQIGRALKVGGNRDRILHLRRVPSSVQWNTGKKFDRLFLAFTVSGAVYVVGQLVAKSDESMPVFAMRLLTVSSISLGVTLAVDAVILPSTDSSHLPESSAETSLSEAVPVLHVFSGTYVGRVSEWVVQLPSSAHGEHTVSASTTLTASIAAHGVTCALFSVKCLVLPTACENEKRDSTLLLATCSDDRTVAVFRRCVQYSSSSVGVVHREWQCVWRGEGHSFSQRRVFTVDMAWTPLCRAEECLIGVGSEDGGVQMLRLSLTDVGRAVATTVFHTPNQHGGHGVTKVCLAFNPHSHAGYLISGGMDGVVMARECLCGYDAREVLPRPSHSPQPVCDEGIQKYSLVGSPDTAKRSSQLGDRVRCVTVTDSLHVIACTEKALLILGADPKSHPLRLSLDELSSEPLSSSETLKSRLVQSIVVIPASPQMDPAPMNTAFFVLALLTAGGKVWLLPYAEADSTIPQDPKLVRTVGQLTLSTALGKFGKCVLASVSIMKCREVLPLSDSETRSSLLFSCHLLHSTVVCSELQMSVEVAQAGALPSLESRLDYISVRPSLHVTAVSPNPATKPSPVGSKHLNFPTALCVWTDHQDGVAHVLLGDRGGGLTVLRLMSIVPAQWEVWNRIQLFRPGAGIATLHVSASRGARQPSLLATHHQGGYHVCSFSDLRRMSELELSPSEPSSCIGELVACPYPLQTSLALTPTAVLFASHSGNVMTIGDRVFFCGSGGAAYSGSLSPVRVVENVRAPRLLSASLQHTLSCLAHCSDGKVLEVVRVEVGGGARAEPSSFEREVPSTAAVVLFSGGLTGTDFNCAACTIAGCGESEGNREVRFLGGNEDGSLVSHTIRRSDSLGQNEEKVEDGSRAVLESKHVTLLRGPHHSNIHCLCVLPSPSLQSRPGETRVVSVGGSSMVVVWRCSEAEEQWCAESVWEGGIEPGDRSGRKHVTQSFKGTRGGEDGLAGQVKPRFLAVCPLSPHSFAVASSDACVSIFDQFPSRSGYCLRLTHTTLFHPASPRPVFCLAPLTVGKEAQREEEGCLEIEPLLIGGDGSGSVAVLLRSQQNETTVVVQGYTKVERAAVNSIAAVRLSAPPGVDEVCWRVMVIADSGQVHLLSLSIGAVAGAAASTVRVHPLACVSVGVTAGRGIAFGSSPDECIACCLERVVRLRVVRRDDADAAEALHIVAERALNVQGVSGLCVDSHYQPSGNIEYLVMVVGQGVEAFTL